MKVVELAQQTCSVPKIYGSQIALVSDSRRNELRRHLARRSASRTTALPVKPPQRIVLTTATKDLVSHVITAG